VTRRRAEQRLPVVLRCTAFSAWWWTVVTVALIGAGFVARGTSLHALVGIGDAALILVAFVVVGELRPIIASHSSDPDGVNLATAFHFAILLRWGIAPALVAVLLATFVGEVTRRKPLYKFGFNAAQYSLSYLAAWGVLLVGGWQASPLAPAQLRPSDLVLIAVAALAYHVVNLTLVGTALAIAARTPWWSTVVDNAGWYTRTTMAVLAIGPLIAVVTAVHAGFLALLVLPLWLVYATAQLSLEREQRAATDPLTGLFNRDQLDQLLRTRLEDVARAGRRIALCVVDLDRFKEVNDTLGHATGDALLQALAARLATAVRASDAVVRLGGDEFVLLLDVQDKEVAIDVVERLAGHVHEPYDLAGVRLEIEMSVGVAMLGEDGEDLETLLRRADVAMYDAKTTGEVVSTYRPELERRTPLSGELVADLRRGMASGELELHYQPQVALPGGEVVGVEALVRWRHPDRGLLGPAAFLPAIERTSTMRTLTSAVLELAFAQCARWRAVGLDVPVSVNVSMHDLADSSFADRVTAGLARHHLVASDIRVEITEQALVGDSAVVLSTLAAFDAAGIEMSLDDFGTGHASLTRLARLPISEVKVDRQFVIDLEQDAPTVVAIVRSVLELARALGARSVAEGVETEGQWAALAALGCDVAQGYLTGRPMPAEEATWWLLARVTPAFVDPVDARFAAAGTDLADR
jgi:diguanylate cyclase (GGDEF)-like protein